MTQNINQSLGKNKGECPRVFGEVGFRINKRIIHICGTHCHLVTEIEKIDDFGKSRLIPHSCNGFEGKPSVPWSSIPNLWGWPQTREPSSFKKPQGDDSRSDPFRKSYVPIGKQELPQWNAHKRLYQSTTPFLGKWRVMVQKDIQS